MADYLVTDTELTSVADAIRTKGGTSAALAWPGGFVEAIGDISGGGVECVRITMNNADAWYVDESMQIVHGVPANVLSPLGSMAIAYGPGDPMTPSVGVTQIAKWTPTMRVSIFIYQVTG